MRAAQTQSLLAALRRLPAAEGKAIANAIGPADIELAKSFLPVAWLPMSLHMRISDAVRDVVGPERNVAVWRETMRHAFDRPLLKSFVALTTGIFGVTPTALLNRAEKLNVLITRDLGELSFESERDRRGVLSLSGFPAHRYRFICYVEGLAGCLEATLDLSRVTGTVEVLDVEPAGNVRLRLSW
jgi:hypothetical protein